MLQKSFSELPNYHRPLLRSVSRRRRACDGASFGLSGCVLAWVRPWEPLPAATRACSSMLCLTDSMVIHIVATWTEWMDDVFLKAHA